MTTMADDSRPPDEVASSSSYSTAVPRSPSPQSDLVSLSSTSDSEDQYSDPVQSASQEDSDLIEAAANTRPRNTEVGGVPVPPSAASTGDISSSAARNGQDQSTPSSSVGQPSASSLEQAGNWVTPPAAAGSLPPAQFSVQDSNKLTVSDYESAGLLYARATKARDNM